MLYHKLFYKLARTLALPALALVLFAVIGCTAATPTPTPAPTNTPLPPPTAVSTPTSAPTDTPLPTATTQPTDTPTTVPTDTPTVTSSPTQVPTKTATTAPVKPPTQKPTTPPTAKPTVAEPTVASPYALPDGKGGLIVRNYYGGDMTFTVANHQYKIPSNGETFIVLDPGDYPWTAFIPGKGQAHGSVHIDAGRLFIEQFADR